MYKIFECKNCNGNGYLIVKNVKCNGKYRFERKVCSKCKGTGLIRELISYLDDMI
jgi:DnaJ-class molecular chaperone